jgi:hypothetical protein
MPKAIPIISPFHNLSAGDLADQLGTLKAEIAELEAREKSLRDELIRRGDAEMGEPWNARCRQALVTTVAVKALAAASKLAA